METVFDSRSYILLHWTCCFSPGSGRKR